MVVCTPISSTLPHLTFLNPTLNRICSKPHLSLNSTRRSFRPTNLGWHYYNNSSLKSTTSEEASSGASQYAKEETDSVVMVEDIQKDEQNESYGAKDAQTVETNGSYGAEGPNEESFNNEQTLPLDFIKKLNMELDLDSPYPLLVYGGSSLITLWLASAVVGAIDSIPVFPKLMEVVGLGYSLWFGSRYLLFKKNRDELTAKIEEIKQEVLGSTED